MYGGFDAGVKFCADGAGECVGATYEVESVDVEEMFAALESAGQATWVAEKAGEFVDGVGRA